VKLRKRAVPAAPPKPPPRPELVSEIPELPKDGGPPEVAAGAGSRLLNDTTGEVVVTLDNGAFRWLWEIAESRSIQQWNHYYGQDTIAAPKAGKRAVLAIRNAAYKQYQPPEDTMPKNHRPYPPKLPGPRSSGGVKKLRRKGG
jgi:hypothetical protein